MRGRIASLAFLNLVAAVLLGCSTGKDAYDAMTPEQRHFATEVLARFTPTTTPEEISAVLGPPYRRSPGKLYWRRPGAGNRERFDAYFLDGRLFKIRYMSLSPMWGWDLNAQGDRLVPAD